VIWGQDDHIIPVAQADAVTPVHRLDATGHLPHMEKSSEVNRRLIEA
jgi:pimeloyl-ACP methyl ester carboxylesterase